MGPERTFIDHPDLHSTHALAPLLVAIPRAALQSSARMARCHHSGSVTPRFLISRGARVSMLFLPTSEEIPPSASAGGPAWFPDPDLPLMPMHMHWVFPKWRVAIEHGKVLREVCLGGHISKLLTPQSPPLRTQQSRVEGRGARGVEISMSVRCLWSQSVSSFLPVSLPEDRQVHTHACADVT